ncbi:hypothetical protein [Streptococcus ferus]|uniref:hypothetical protein n=1 Tax=Streptococcus ferus TaxID=1345 RepID=UPI00359F4C5A
MVLTDQHYSLSAEIPYWLEKARDDVPYYPVENEVYPYHFQNKALGHFQILRAFDNPQNGFQVTHF